MVIIIYEYTDDGYLDNADEYASVLCANVYDYGDNRKCITPNQQLI